MRIDRKVVLVESPRPAHFDVLEDPLRRSFVPAHPTLYTVRDGRTVLELAALESQTPKLSLLKRRAARYVSAQRELRAMIASLPWPTRFAYRAFLLVARVWRALERRLP